MPLIKLYIDVCQTIPLEDQAHLSASALPYTPMGTGFKRYSFEVNIPTPECEQAEKLSRVSTLIEEE